MTQKFTAEEVRKIATNLDELVAPITLEENIVLNRAAAALRAYADTLSKPADSGRVDGMADLLADWRRAADAHDEIGFGAAADVGRTCAGDLEAALAAQGQGEAVAWHIDTDDDVERVAKAAGWDNRRYMTPADYAIWCIRMREFVRLAAVHTAPPASPAGVPDGWVLVPREPTPGMIGACVAVWQERIRLKSESGTLLCGGNAEQSFRENWSAMIGAAPQTRAAEGEVKAADFATAMRSCGLSLKTYAEVDREARRIAEERATPSAPKGFPECSGDPASCPENEGYGCCKPNPSAPQEVE